MNSKFFKNFPHMAVNRVGADAQMISDFLVGLTLAKEREHFFFPAGQVGQFMSRTVRGRRGKSVFEILPHSIEHLLRSRIRIRKRAGDGFEKLGR